MRKVSFVPTVVFGVIGIAFGILFALLAGVIFDIILIVCGVFTLISAIPQFIFAIKGFAEKKRVGMAVFDLVMSIITVAVGIMLIFYRNEIVMIAIGAYLLVFPLIRTLLATRKAEQLKAELPSMILGVILMIVAPRDLIGILGKVAGAVIIVISILYMVIGLVIYFKAKKIAESISGSRVYVDTDGNGTIDTMYVDTTNDGVYNTEIKIKEDEKTE